MSIYLLNRGTVPLGALVAGLLADRFGVETALHITAAIALAIVGLVVLNFPQILRLKVPLQQGTRTAEAPTPAPAPAGSGGA